MSTDRYKASLESAKEFIYECEGFGQLEPETLVQKWKDSHLDLVSYLGSPVFKMPAAPDPFLDLAQKHRSNVIGQLEYLASLTILRVKCRETLKGEARELFTPNMGLPRPTAWKEFFLSQKEHLIEHGTFLLGKRQFRPAKLIPYLLEKPHLYPAGEWGQEYNEYNVIENSINNISHWIGQAERIEKLVEGKDAEYVIDCSLPAFMKLASYGIDRGSCYEAGHEWEAGPLILASTVGSFVGLVKIGGSVVGRHFGFILPEIETIITSNFYPRDDGDMEEVTIEMSKKCLLKFAKDKFDDDTCRIVNRISKSPNFDLYWNDDHWGIKPVKCKEAHLVCLLDIQLTRCTGCGEYMRGDTRSDYEGEQFHPNCIDEYRQFVEEEGEWYHADDCVADQWGNYILAENAVEDYAGNWIRISESVELHDGQFAHEEDDDIVYVEKEHAYYHVDDAPEEKETEKCENQ